MMDIKNRSDIFFSFLFYSIGLLAFFLVDISVVRNYAKESIAEWAFLKSVILIVGSICLLGYDQVFVRDTSLIQRFFKRFNLQAVGIVLLLGIFLYVVKQYPVSKLIILLATVYLFALNSYIAASYRAKFNLWRSQFSTNLWRIMLLGSVLIFSYENVNLYFLQSIFFAILVIICLGAFKLMANEKYSAQLDDRTAQKLGYSFVLTNFTLILAVYGEQFLINLKGDSVEVSSHLFTYFSIFTPIALSLNGFIGFYYAPKVRKENNMTLNRYKKIFIKIFAYSVAVTILSVITGTIYMKYGLLKSLMELDYMLIISLSVLCIVRGSYMATSVCLGVFGDADTLKRFASGMLGSTVVYICLIFFILSLPVSIYTALWISLASVFNWMMRFSISNYYTFSNLKIRNKDVHAGK